MLFQIRLCAVLLLQVVSLLSPPARAAEQAAWPSAGRVAGWVTSSDAGSSIGIKDSQVDGRGSIAVTYTLSTDHSWVEIRTATPAAYEQSNPFVFSVKNDGVTCDLEIKLIAANGSVFGRKVPLKGRYREWTRLVLTRASLEYWWGGDGTFDKPSAVALAISGSGAGQIWFAGMGTGAPGETPTFPPAGPVLDPNRDLAGYGFAARRSRTLSPEDPLVLEYLKRIQDKSSPDGWLVPAQEDNSAQTFNNALVAMAFTLKRERARAERILDFYARATIRSSEDPQLQNFYLRGEARGFYQNVTLRKADRIPAYHDAAGSSDRWMGDMAWLLLAAEYHDREFKSQRYRDLVNSIDGLLLAWFKNDGADTGYVQHGWRSGDKYLNEKSGHEEGNIDCYAVFQLLGDTEHAQRIKAWLSGQLQGRNTLPLDLYSWRALAYGKEAARLLSIPETDLRYRKSLTINGQSAMGFHHSADINVNNVWLDGLGHMACAEFACGDADRGRFYANQMDAFLIERRIGGVRTRALPYTALKNNPADWVDPKKGFSSACAWYIFAKNRFNPMMLTKSL
ncbi:MAG TPA: hypothetical protein VGM51_14215 [Armatimonadota bacterium]|jgi:hypothetical protein